MLDLLISATRNNEMNDSDVKEEVDTFIFTVSICISLIFYIEIIIIVRNQNKYINQKTINT